MMGLMDQAIKEIEDKFGPKFKAVEDQVKTMQKDVAEIKAIVQRIEAAQKGGK